MILLFEALIETISNNTGMISEIVEEEWDYFFNKAYPQKLKCKLQAENFDFEFRSLTLVKDQWQCEEQLFRHLGKPDFVKDAEERKFIFGDSIIMIIKNGMFIHCKLNKNVTLSTNFVVIQIFFFS